MKVRVELIFDMDARDIVELSKKFDNSSYSRVTFGEGQSNIDADRALGAFVDVLRSQLQLVRR